MRKSFLTTLAIITYFLASAQIQTNETPLGLRYAFERGTDRAQVISFDNSQAYTKMAEEGKHPRFAGFSIPANIRFSELATRVELCPDTTIWQLHLHIPEANKLGVVFSEFELPKNGKLFLYDETGKNHIGALTAKNNHYSGILSVRPIPATTITIEYFAPNVSRENLPSIVIEEIIYIVNSLEFDQKIEQKRQATNCFVSVNCPEGANWQKQKRGVARILLREGTQWFYCTGTLINNTREDGDPLFLTADHCGENSSDDDMLVWQFLFNYEYPACTQSAIPPDERHVITGSTFLSKGSLTGGSDFRLLRLSQRPPTSWNTFYNGWSRDTSNPLSGVGIHHPNGNPKKISTYTSPLFRATYPDGMVGGAWRVIWARTDSGHSVTEVGSSGSPLFNSEGLIVGTLSGGASSCASLNLPDYYGKFYRHWSANGNLPSQQLQPWLDPDNTNTMTLYGYDPMLATNMVTLSVNPQNSGFATGGGFYAKGENVVLTSVPDTAFFFVNWTNEHNQILSNDSVFRFSMPDTNLYITANFAPIITDNEEVELGKNLFITPNPAYDHINIRSEKPLGLIFYRLYNSTGQELKEGAIPATTRGQIHKIELTNIQNGFYILYLIIDGKVLSHKLIIMGRLEH